MEYHGGVFPVNVSISNCAYSVEEWKRNIDLIMFRFPTRKKDGSYELDIDNLARRCHDSLSSRGWVVAYAYASIENKLRPFVFAANMVKAGFTLVDIVVATRPWWGGKRSDTHLAMSHEYVFLFSKSDDWYLDRSSIYPLLIGEKYEDASCPGNAWDIKWNLKNFNPAENYSAELAAAIMKMVCLLPGSVILDPFMGGSSGMEAAVHCGHSFIGYETDVERYNKYAKIIKKLSKVVKERDHEHGQS